MPKICIHMHIYVYYIYIYIYLLILCSWDQNKTTIWILESAVPSCLGNVNPSVLTTDISYCENRFSAPRFAVQVMWACSASQTNKSPHCPPSPSPSPSDKISPQNKSTSYPDGSVIWKSDGEKKKQNCEILFFYGIVCFETLRLSDTFTPLWDRTPPHTTPPTPKVTSGPF